MGAAGGGEDFSCDAAEMVGVDRACTPPCGDRECGSNSEIDGLIKLATKRGGARAGAGRKAKADRRRDGGGWRWYCIQVQPRGELAVIHALVVRGFGVHCPTIRLDAGAVPVMRFPGYLFVRFDRDGVAWRSIPAMERVVRLFSSSPEMPTPLRRGYVEGLIEEAGPEGFVDASGDGAGDLRVGTVVRLNDGLLGGCVGTVERCSARWVTVMVGFFGQTTPVTVARQSVSVAESR